MKKFTYYWLDGKREVLEGNDVADAMNRVGYGAGALRALDFHSNGDCNDYVWNKLTRNWDMTEEAKEKLFGRNRLIKIK